MNVLRKIGLAKQARCCVINHIAAMPQWELMTKLNSSTKANGSQDSQLLSNDQEQRVDVVISDS
ncbi:MAG: hypothetical protein COB71_05915 [Thiotrichales bacterium]|nr:MAG: hypothetical protein COB71_05915 [Thiotrichales bacterium]